MLQRIFHASTGILQLMMYIIWLFAKLRPIIDMAFLTRLWYLFNTLGFTLECEVFSYLSTMSQRSMKAKTISILNFQRLNFSLLNLSMTLAPLLLSCVIFVQKMHLYDQKFQIKFSSHEGKLRTFKSLKYNPIDLKYALNFQVISSPSQENSRDT